MDNKTVLEAGKTGQKTLFKQIEELGVSTQSEGKDQGIKSQEFCLRQKDGLKPVNRKLEPGIETRPQAVLFKQIEELGVSTQSEGEDQGIKSQEFCLRQKDGLKPVNRQLEPGIETRPQAGVQTAAGFQLLLGLAVIITIAVTFSLLLTKIGSIFKSVFGRKGGNDRKKKE